MLSLTAKSTMNCHYPKGSVLAAMWLCRQAVCLNCVALGTAGVAVTQAPHISPSACLCRVITNKLLLSVIIVLELAILVGLVYYKFFRHH